MDKTLLKAEKRNVIGKGIKKLRRDGWLPAILYGPSLDPVAIQLSALEASNVLRRIQGTVLIDLEVEGNIHTTIVRDLQSDILRGNPTHVDFFAVDMLQKLTINVPISLVGESIADASGELAVMTNLFEVQVECLPNDIINVLEVDKESLTELGDTLIVADIEVPEGITILTDSNETVARVAYAGIIEVEEEVEDEEALDIDAEDVEVIEKGKSSDDEDQEFSSDSSDA